MCKQCGPHSPEDTASLGHGVKDAKGMMGRVEGRWEVAEKRHDDGAKGPAGPTWDRGDSRVREAE